MGISEFEDKILVAKDNFLDEFKNILNLVKINKTDSSQVQEALTNLHARGVKYFDLFGRSITEYGIKDYKHNKNIRNSKIDDTVNILNTILRYWNFLKNLKENFDIITPNPSERAYSSIQLFIKNFEPEKAKDYKLKFEELNLPIYGFESKRGFHDMTKKQQVTYGIIAGTILLVVLLVIAVVIDCPTQSQNRTFTTILALAAAAFSATIPGFINVKYREIITASGALAVFVIVFLLKPAEISDFKRCSHDISGIVFYDNKPVSSVEVRLLKQNQLTNTDSFGKYSLSVDFSSIKGDLQIQLIKPDLGIDTVIVINKQDLEETIDIYIK